MGAPGARELSGAASPPPAGGLARPRLVLAIVAVALLATAGIPGLIEPTETRYAEIAREMRVSGDWIVPRLDGIEHFHKPPLAYWLTAAGFAAFGTNEWGARVPCVLAGLALLVFLGVLARRRFGPLLEAGAHAAGSAGSKADVIAADRLAPAPSGVAGATQSTTIAIAMWVLASSPLFLGPGRSVSCDPYLATEVAGFWALAGTSWGIALLGLGFVTKGPVVFVPTVLPILVVALWDRLARRRAANAESPRTSPATTPAAAPKPAGALALLGPRRAWLLFAIIALPWYLLLVARVPGLLAYLLENQLWQRYTSGVHHREGGWWYFIAVLAAGTLPWTPALVAGAVHAWRERARREARLLLAWLVAPLVFFSFSGSKLPSYLLPCLPAAALLAAIGFARGGRAVRKTTAATVALVAVAGAVAMVTAWPRMVGAAPGGAAPIPPLVIAGLIAIAAAAVASWRGRIAGSAALVLAGLLTIVVGLAPFERHLGSPRPLARLIADHGGAGDPIIEHRRLNAGLPFYLGRPVYLLDVSRELMFERSARGPVIAARDVPALVDRTGRAWLLGPEAPGRELAQSLGLDYQKVATGSRSTLAILTRP